MRAKFRRICRVVLFAHLLAERQLCLRALHLNAARSQQGDDILVADEVCGADSDESAARTGKPLFDRIRPCAVAAYDNRIVYGGAGVFPLLVKFARKDREIAARPWLIERVHLVRFVLKLAQGDG